MSKKKAEPDGGAGPYTFTTVLAVIMALCLLTGKNKVDNLKDSLRRARNDISCMQSKHDSLENRHERLVRAHNDLCDEVRETTDIAKENQQIVNPRLHDEQRPPC